MPTVVVVRHAVEDFAQWKLVFDKHRANRESHGALGHQLLIDESDPGTQLILNEFPTRADAEAFISDPSLAQAMARAGVTGTPRIELYEFAERVTY
jgi:hypothetical protein